MAQWRAALTAVERWIGVLEIVAIRAHQVGLTEFVSKREE
jgi:hypothetical protein